MSYRRHGPGFIPPILLDCNCEYCKNYREAPMLREEIKKLRKEIKELRSDLYWKCGVRRR
jgi:hypothetical protein